MVSDEKHGETSSLNDSEHVIIPPKLSLLRILGSDHIYFLGFQQHDYTFWLHLGYTVFLCL